MGCPAPADYPSIVDPPDGCLWTANNRVVGGAWLALEGDGNDDLGARAQQVHDDLSARQQVTPQDLRDTLTRNRAGPELRALDVTTAVWNGRAGIDRVSYHAAHAFRERGTADVLAPFVARVKARYPQFAWPSSVDGGYAVWALVTQRLAHLLNGRYPSWNALLADWARQVAEDFTRAPSGVAAQTLGPSQHHPQRSRAIRGAALAERSTARAVAG
jgi:penicillin G amidase